MKAVTMAVVITIVTINKAEEVSVKISRLQHSLCRELYQSLIRQKYTITLFGIVYKLLKEHCLKSVH